METETTAEGRTELIIPKRELYGKLPPEKQPVFYNPVMEFCRSVSVCVLLSLKQELKKLEVCDALAASGARGLRYANEAGAEATFIDRNKQAVELIGQNAKRLGIKATVLEGDASTLLPKRKHQVVDLDPFGSPVPFLGAAAASAEKFFMATATDTRVLCGIQPEACRKFYGAEPLKGEICHEAGARILLRKAADAFAAHGKSIEPVLTQSTDHYFRIYCRVEKQAGKVPAGYINFNKETGERFLSEKKTKRRGFASAGPLWAGKLFDKKFCELALESSTEYGSRVQKFFQTAVGEAGIGGPYYNVHWLCARFGADIPRTQALIGALRGAGWAAATSHMGKQPSLRTDAKLKDLKKVISSF